MNEKTNCAVRTVVYQYGLLQPTENDEAVAEQISKAHRYYNILIEIERRRRDAVNEAQRRVPELCAALSEADACAEKLARLRAQAKAAKSRDGKTKAPAKGLIQAMTTALREARVRVKDIKKKHQEELLVAYGEADEAAHLEQLRARAECGVYWGTYLQIEQAAHQASRSAAPPRFRRWTGHGVVAVQCQGGLPSTEVFGDNTRVQIAPVKDTAWDSSLPRGKRRTLQYTTLRLRVGSHGRDPLWAEWPLYMHRPLPADGTIKWVKVLRRPWHQRWQYRWVVQITIELPEVSRWLGTQQRGAIVGVNLGWRLMEDGSLRVATWADDRGQTGEVRLPIDLYRDCIERAERIRSERDKNLDQLKAMLVERKITGYGRWKSPARFHALAKQAKRDGTMSRLSDLLSAWAYRDNHLFWYERGLRNKALRYRREVYRQLALELTSSYPVVVVECYDLRRIVTDEQRLPEPAAQRVEAAPSEARHAIRSAGSRLGCAVVDADSRLATQQCHLCGYGRAKGERWDAAPNVIHTCYGCGETWDQDKNNAQNLVARAMVLFESGELLAEQKPKRKARFHKRHRNNENATV